MFYRFCILVCGMAFGYSLALYVNQAAVTHKCPLPPPPAVVVCGKGAL